MNFKNLIQASATVIQITQLSKGDTFKLIQESDYSAPVLKYGLVTEVMNDGTKGYVSAIIMEANYNGITNEVKLLSETEMGKIAIFPTTWEEIKVAMKDSIDRADKDIKNEEEKIEKKKESLKFAKEIVSGSFLPENQEPKYQICEPKTEVL